MTEFPLTREEAGDDRRYTVKLSGKYGAPCGHIPATSIEFTDGRIKINPIHGRTVSTYKEQSVEQIYVHAGWD